MLTLETRKLFLNESKNMPEHRQEVIERLQWCKEHLGEKEFEKWVDGELIWTIEEVRKFLDSSKGADSTPNKDQRNANRKKKRITLSKPLAMMSLDELNDELFG